MVGIKDTHSWFDMLTMSGLTGKYACIDWFVAMLHNGIVIRCMADT
jgi:hypothetical protein